MHYRISIIIVWLSLFIFSSDTYAFLLSSRKCFKRYFVLIHITFILLLTALVLFLPDSHILYLPTCSAGIILFPALFYRGNMIEKAVAAITFYLFSIISDMVSTIAGYIVQILFTSVPVSGNIILAGTPLSLTIYSILFSLSFFVYRCVLLPRARYYLDIFGTAFFFRIAGPFLLLYLASNVFLTVVYIDSAELFICLSFVFFLVTGLLTRYALRSFRFLLEREKEHTQLVLQKKQLELIAAHNRELSDKYKDIRRLNHDISSHLTALSYLISIEKWKDAEDYIDTLMNTKENRL